MKIKTNFKGLVLKRKRFIIFFDRTVTKQLSAAFIYVECENDAGRQGLIDNSGGLNPDRRIFMKP